MLMPFGMDMYYRREGANNANGLGGVCNAGGGCDLAQFLGSSGRRPCSLLLLHRSGTNKDLGCSTIALPCSPPSPASVRPPFQPRCLLSPRLASRVVSKVHSSNWLLQLRSSQVRLTPESGRRRRRRRRRQRICPWGTKQPPKGPRDGRTDDEVCYCQGHFLALSLSLYDNLPLRPFLPLKQSTLSLIGLLARKQGVEVEDSAVLSPIRQSLLGACWIIF